MVSKKFQRLLLYVSMFLFTSFGRAQPSQVSLLNEAYKTKSAIKLKLFIDRWAKSSSVFSTKWSLTKNDTIKAFNDIYRLFYLNENAYVSQINSSSQKTYIVIEDNPLLVITDTLPIVDPEVDGRIEQDYETLERLTWKEGNHEQWLQSYIPVLGIQNIVILSLTKGYDSIIEEFLKVKPGEKLKNEYGELLNESGHNEQKVQFLSPYLPMVKRHWGHYWNFLSYPKIKRIIFDKKFTSALVSYSLSSRGGLACFQKTVEGWRLIDQRTLYIQ